VAPGQRGAARPPDVDLLPSLHLSQHPQRWLERLLLHHHRHVRVQHQAAHAYEHPDRESLRHGWSRIPSSTLTVPRVSSAGSLPCSGSPSPVTLASRCYVPASPFWFNWPARSRSRSFLTAMSAVRSLRSTFWKCTGYVVAQRYTLVRSNADSDTGSIHGVRSAVHVRQRGWNFEEGGRVWNQLHR
jgi:hypothetical protein